MNQFCNNKKGQIRVFGQVHFWSRNSRTRVFLDRHFLQNDMKLKLFHFMLFSAQKVMTHFTESPKTKFLGYFWPFLVIFAKMSFQNITVKQNPLYGPWNPCWNPEKSNEPILRKNSYGHTNRWADTGIDKHKIISVWQVVLEW